MKIFLRFSAAIILCSLISSCAYLEKFMAHRAPAEPDYIDKGVKMDIKKFFSGDLDGFAIIQGSDGKITGTQTVKITSKWDENKGVMTQNYVLNDGKKDSRTWLITLNPDGTFDAVGHDIVAPAHGKQIGNVAQMIYTLSLPVVSETATGKEEVEYEDRMYLVDEKSMIMISDIRRSGAAGKVITSLKRLNGKSDKSE